MGEADPTERERLSGSLGRSPSNHTMNLLFDKAGQREALRKCIELPWDSEDGGSGVQRGILEELTLQLGLEGQLRVI